MKRPVSPWIVSLLSFAAIVTVVVIVVTIANPHAAHVGGSDFDSGEQLGRAMGPGALLVAAGAYFLQRRRVKRYEESQATRS